MTALRLLDGQRGWTYDYVAVGADWDDGAAIHGILPGGTVERIMSSEKESGTLPCASLSEIPDDGRIRIYANDAYTGGRFALATMRVARPSSTITSAKGESADVELLSVLTYASSDMPTSPYVLEAGDNIVEAVKDIFEGLGLKVDATPSSAVLSEGKVYEEDDWLTIANDLLTGTPNYASAWPDRYGTVMLRPYVDPGDKAAKAHFSDTGEARDRFCDGLGADDDWYSIPNRLVLVCETDDATYRAVAEDETGSRLSHDARGYWVTVRETIDEVPSTGIQDWMDDRAAQMLRAKQSNVAAWEFTGEFIAGLELSDAVSFDWQRQDLSGIRSVYSMTYNLTRSLLVDYRIREYMRGSS